MICYFCYTVNDWIPYNSVGYKRMNKPMASCGGNLLLVHILNNSMPFAIRQYMYFYFRHKSRLCMLLCQLPGRYQSTQNVLPFCSHSILHYKHLYKCLYIHVYKCFIYGYENMNYCKWIECIGIELLNCRICFYKYKFMTVYYEYNHVHVIKCT